MVLQYVVDAVLVIVFAVCVIMGIRNGFIKTILTFAAVALALVAAVMLSRSLAPVVYDKYVDERAYKSIHARLTDSTDSTLALTRQQVLEEVMPKTVMDVAGSVGIDAQGMIKSIGDFDGSVDKASRGLTDGVVKPVFTAAIKSALFVAGFLVCFALLKLIVFLIDRFARLPVVKTVNKTMGALLGALAGVGVLWFASKTLVIAGGLLAGTAVEDAVRSSYIVEFLTSGGLLEKLISINGGSQ